MRISFLEAGRQALSNLQAIQARKFEAGDQIASGLRVTKASDSPPDAAGVVRTNSDLREIRQLTVNLQGADAELRVADAVLSESGELLRRATSLASQAASGFQDAQTRSLIQIEVEAIFRQLVSLSNTLGGGRFIFGGVEDDLTPFVLDPNSPDGVVYVGSSRAREILFPDRKPARISLAGDAVFLSPNVFLGAGRQAETPGAAVPNPPVGIGIAFEGDVDGVISTDLGSFFVAAAPPGLPLGGERITVNFTSTEPDPTIVTSITTPPLAGGEDAAAIAALLNAEIANNPQLASGLTFSDQGGRLQLVQSDTLGVGFSFTSNATGGLTTGLESGGITGGQSAAEIATALNARVAANPRLFAANIRFVAVNGEVQVDGNVDFTFTAVDFDRGTGFRSGLAGTHLVGGANSENVLGSVFRLVQDLRNNDQPAIIRRVQDLQRAVDHISGAQGLYGGILRQVSSNLDSLGTKDRVNQEQLSRLRDADLLEAIRQFSTNSAAEQAALQVSSQIQQQPSLLDILT